MNLLVNEKIEVYIEDAHVVAKIIQKPENLSGIKEQLESHPRVFLNKWDQLESKVEEMIGESVEDNIRPIVIGDLKPLIRCKLSDDKMRVTMWVNALESEWETKKEEVKKLVYEWLAANNVTYGILNEMIERGLGAQCELIIAEGKEVINGKDAKLTYFTLAEKKPRIKERDTVDYFDIHFIDEVNKGDWLGEKQPPTLGTNGMTVLGTEVVAKAGKDKKLLYDVKTVMSVSEEDKEVLRSLVDGAVTFDHKGLISVVSVLTIDGDVGIRTGNINYKGSVIVKGTVEAGFSVVAAHDVSVMSDMGVTSAKIIKSLNGDVFIKGGSFGRTVIKAKNNVFVKYVQESLIEAGGNVTVGTHILNSYINATNILVDPRKGKIIGGTLKAEGVVVSGSIGTKLELKTEIHLAGFHRAELETEKKTLAHQKEEVSKQLDTILDKVKDLQMLKGQSSRESILEYVKNKEFADQLLEERQDMEQRLQKITSLLGVKGVGEVTSSAVYPGTLIVINGIPKIVKTLSKGSFYLEDGEILLM